MVSADSRLELAGLEELVRAGRNLKLAGSTLGRMALGEQLATLDADVVIERLTASTEADSESIEFAPDGGAPIPTLILADESEYANAIARLYARGSGVRGVLPSWAGENEIHVAIESVAGGLIVLHPDLLSSLTIEATQPGADRAEARGAALSPRETEVLNLLAAGLANKEIAWRLKISDHTVKFHVTSIFTKLDVSNRAEAVTNGIRRGLISI